MKKEKLMFWFCDDSRRLGYNDGRKAVAGRTHKVKGDIEKCRHGLHASEKIMDALSFQKGNVLFLVRLGGQVKHDSDKSVATERTYVSSFNAEKILRKFARKLGLINIEKIKPYCTKENYGMIVRFLRTGDEKLRSAAYYAANSAAYSTVCSTARSAARSAAYSAAYSAVCSTACYAACSAACYTVCSTARSEAYSAAEKMLRKMIRKETGWKI